MTDADERLILAYKGKQREELFQELYHVFVGLLWGLAIGYLMGRPGLS